MGTSLESGFVAHIELDAAESKRVTEKVFRGMKVWGGGGYRTEKSAWGEGVARGKWREKKEG
jgi:hypothetical protein